MDSHHSEHTNQQTDLKPYDSGNKTKVIVTVAVLLVAVLLVVGIKAFASKPEETATNGTTQQSSGADSSGSGQNSGAAADPAGTTYKDGTYDATGSYTTPESQEEIKVSLTVKDGTVTDTNVSFDPKKSESRQWQQRFASGYKQEVVGKPLSSLSLSRVSGSSLTPMGFNDAVDTIRQQAKS